MITKPRTGGRTGRFGCVPPLFLLPVCLAALLCSPAICANPPSGVRPLPLSGEAVGTSEDELRLLIRRAFDVAAQRSPTLQRGLAEIDVAAAEIDEAKGQRWPQVSVGADRSYLSGGRYPDRDRSGRVDARLNITTPLYDGGRIRHTIASRQHAAVAAEAALAAQHEVLGHEIVANLLERDKQRLIVQVSEQFEVRMQALVTMLADIVAVDRGRTSELTQAKARLLSAQAARENAQARAQEAEINLRARLGEQMPVFPAHPHWPFHRADLDDLLRTLDQHPSIQQAQASVAAAERQADVVRAAAVPQVSWDINKSTAEDALGRPSPWQTSLTVSWAAFRGGSAKAARRAALHRAEAAQKAMAQQQMDLELRVRRADQDAAALFARADLYRELSVESDAIRTAFFEQWHHLGRRSLLEVLTAESEHYGNQVGEVSSRFDGYQAIARQYADAGVLRRWVKHDPLESVRAAQ